MPLLLVIMIIVFGALVAASLPLLVGGMAILGGFAVTRVITEFTDVSVFAANVITIIGLGMSIDYSLFVLRRFREELTAGRDKRRAVLGTIATAGRTVMVSGLIIVLSMGGLLFVDVPFLHGIAYGVMSAVGVAMVSALVVLPAMLYLLGHRVDRGRLPWRKGKTPKTETGFWHGLGAGVMRRPVLVLLPVLAFMALLAAPVLDASFGGTDERDMPADAESRVVAETLDADFPGGEAETLDVMVSGGERPRSPKPCKRSNASTTSRRCPRPPRTATPRSSRSSTTSTRSAARPATWSSRSASSTPLQRSPSPAARPNWSTCSAPSATACRRWSATSWRSR
ncbi:hypothetical protein GCM10029992_60620 [Glycomyces albus]